MASPFERSDKKVVKSLDDLAKMLDNLKGNFFG